MKLQFAALAFGILAFVAASAYSQEPEPVKGFDRNKLFIGGNFGLNFGSSTLVNLSPQIGYRFNRYFAAGVGINGQYSSFRTSVFNDGSTARRESYGVAGLNVFGRVYPIEQVFLQLQPEANYTWGKIKDYTTSPASEGKLPGKMVPSLLAGAGGVIPAGRGGFIILAQYDLLQNNRTPYGDKVFFSFGYNFGL
ncbi:MAG: hypothetical protein ABI687_00590 [Flavitalea sp.]